MASPVLTRCLQEAKRASGATFIMKFWFQAKKKESAAKNLISICQSVNLAESAKMHATQKSEFRRPSRYLERARNYRDGEWVLRSYACRCFSARQGLTGLRSSQTKKLSKLLTKGLVLIYIYTHIIIGISLTTIHFKNRSKSGNPLKEHFQISRCIITKSAE